MIVAAPVGPINPGARDENVERIVAIILLQNVAMRAMASRQGFQIQKDSDLGVVQAVLTL
jgi:hypothetical protein